MDSVARRAVLPGMEGHARAEVGDTDHFPTPEWVTAALLDSLPLHPRHILEPACGTGSICRVLRSMYSCAHITGVEVREDIALSTAGNAWRNDPRFDELACWDFHDWAQHANSRRFDLIITNPPYGNDEPVKFFESAWPLLADGGQLAMLLRLNWLAGAKRAAFHREHPADVYVVARRIAFLDNGSSPTESHAWFVWTKGEPGGRWEVLA